MNARIFSLFRMFTVVVAVIMFIGASLFSTGCASSEEMEMEEPPPDMAGDPVQQILDSLYAENASLRSRINTLEQDNRNLTAQVAELETKLAQPRTSVPQPPPPMRMGDTKDEYDHALSLFNQKNYEEALSVWMGLLNTSPPEGLESNCHYWIGECFYGMKQYQEALSHFQRIFDYDRTSKKDDAQLKIALCYERMGDKARAKQEYEKLIEQYPASPYVSNAKAKAAKL